MMLNCDCIECDKKYLKQPTMDNAKDDFYH